MSTANFLILAALTKLGKNSPLKPAKAADVLTGFNSLGPLLHKFETQNIILNTNPIQNPNSEVGESIDTRNAIIDLLAIEIAPNYDNGQIIVSETLRGSAQDGMAFLKKWYKKVTPIFRRISSTAPRGAGNERYRYSRKFFGPERILEEPEAVLEANHDPLKNT